MFSNVETSRTSGPSRGCLLFPTHAELSVILRGFWGFFALFPLAILLLVTSTFLLGGHCAPWQAVVGLVVAGMSLWLFTRGNLKAFFWSGVLVGLYLLFIWFVTGCFAVNDCDSASYHLPVVRLLMAGWNPVQASTPEALAAFSGMSLSEFWWRHVLFIVHPIEMVDAVLAFYTKAPFNLLFPCYALLAPVCLGTLWCWLRTLGWSRLIRATTWGLFFCESVVFLIGSGVVDSVVFLSSTALLAAMLRYLSERKAVGELLLFSLWMMICKQSALVTCFVFWVCFSLLLLWQSRKALLRTCLRLALWGGLLTLALGYLCFSPYLTSWKTYGHPLYPAYSIDEARFPTYDITGDFQDRNDDAKQMSHFGHFANAFLSARLTQRYYAWKLGRPNFLPQCRVWTQDNPRRSGDGSPVSSLQRTLFLFAFLVLCFSASRPLQIYGWIVFTGLICFPTPYLGYTRYTPWVTTLPILAVSHLLYWLQRRYNFKRVLRVFAGFLLAFEVSRPMFRFCLALEGLDEVERLARGPGIITFAGDNPDKIGHLRLLVRQEPRFAHCEVVWLDSCEETYYKLTLPHLYLHLSPDIKPQPTLYAQAMKEPSRIRRYQYYLCFIPNAICRTLPRVLWRRLVDIVQR
ncbi:MAG: hypothetical protein ACI4QJ_04115 [Candidatus Spyradenecus sp.]